MRPAHPRSRPLLAACSLLLAACSSAGIADFDGDGVPDSTDCDPQDATIYAGAPDAYGDGVDSDCNGADGTDADGDGHADLFSGGDDCNDGDPTIHPDAPEIADDNIDQDCGGAFGTVYRAEVRGELGYSQDVALKLIDPGRAAADQELLDSLADEARILTRIQHPAIVHVRRLVSVSHEVLGDTLGLEMELVRGASLRQILDGGIRLPTDCVLTMLSELLEGLEYAHTASDADGAPLGLVHRDLKPGNILITTEGRLKVLDFGIARSTGRSVQETTAGQTKGTPLYMSPEQLCGDELDGRSDLYAVGELAFEFITGETYVDLSDVSSGDLQAVLMRASQTRFEDREPALRQALGHVEPDRAEGIVQLIRWLTEPDAYDRPPDAGEALELLAPLCAAVAPHAARKKMAAVVAGLRARVDAPPRVAAPVERTRQMDKAALEAPPPEPDSATDWLVPAEGLNAPRELGGAGRRPPLPLLVGAGLLVVAVLLVVLRPDRTPAPAAAVPPPAPAVDEPPSAEGERPATAEAPELPPPAQTEVAVADPAAGPAPAAAPGTTPASPPAASPVAQPTPRPGSPRATPTPLAAKAQPTPAPATNVWPPPKATVLPPPDDTASALTFEHRPPSVAVPGSSLSLRATLQGDPGSCRPTVHLAPKEGAYRSVAMSGGGASWSASIDLPYDAAHAAGVRYYLSCCAAAGPCATSWRSASNPAFVPPPAF